MLCGVIETFAALAEPNRFRIVELLRSGARTVNEIGERLELNQPQVSKHLRVLKDAGLVDVEPRAQQRVYELRAQAAARAARLARALPQGLGRALRRAGRAARGAREQQKEKSDDRRKRK